MLLKSNVLEGDRASSIKREHRLQRYSHLYEFRASTPQQKSKTTNKHHELWVGPNLGAALRQASMKAWSLIPALLRHWTGCWKRVPILAHNGDGLGLHTAWYILIWSTVLCTCTPWWKALHVYQARVYGPVTTSFPGEKTRSHHSEEWDTCLFVCQGHLHPMCFSHEYP